jgi:hypothetical protein
MQLAGVSAGGAPGLARSGRPGPAVRGTWSWCVPPCPAAPAGASSVASTVVAEPYRFHLCAAS